MGIETADHAEWQGDSVSQILLEEMRDAIIRGIYDLTRHAVDEMAEDYLASLISSVRSWMARSSGQKRMTLVGRDISSLDWLKMEKRR